jgi:hypothetical protein
MQIESLWSYSWSFRKAQATLTTVIDQAPYTLPADVDLLASLAYWGRLTEWSIETSDRIDPQRDTSGGDPTRFIYRGETASGQVVIELWPTPSAVIEVPYSYLKQAPVYVAGTDDAVSVPLPDDVLDWLTVSEGLYALVAEKPELPGGQMLLTLADRRQQQGQMALKEALYQDLKKAGAAEAIRDADTDDWMDGYFALNHDYGV